MKDSRDQWTSAALLLVAEELIGLSLSHLHYKHAECIRIPGLGSLQETILNPPARRKAYMRTRIKET